MVAKEGFLGCPPNENNGSHQCGCGQTNCGKMKYIQPLPPKSFKPEMQYEKPTAPMDSNTVYKNSFHVMVPKEVKMMRTKPILPVNSLQPSKSKIDEHTITKLSFPEHTEPCKRDPILPHNRAMLGNGPMQDYTTQKHDYVAKPTCKRNPIIHETNIKTNNVPLENETVQKLSFVAPDTKSLAVAKSFKPFFMYKRPDVPMEDTTTHKMSFLPVCPPTKEDFPWAKKLPIYVPDVPVEQHTTYKLSFIPNSGTHRPKAYRNKDNQGLVTSSVNFHDHTIYKESFYGPGGYYKRTPILPTLQLHTSDAKMNPDSVYNLSYPGHNGIRKRNPILPHSRYLLGSGPLDDLTTQRRDFVVRPQSRRNPIIPTSQMEKVDSPFENQTTMKLSFMEPNGPKRSTPIRPKDGVTPSNVPMDAMTIHKLSFVPVTPPKKEEYPWAQRKTHNPDGPMDLKSTQNLSFLPPGELIKVGSGCNCSHPGECMSHKFPKADSY